MSERGDRDIEKRYSTSEFVAKLRRLADALEQGDKFEIQIAGKQIYVPVRAEFILSTSAKDLRKRSNFRSSGRTIRRRVSPHLLLLTDLCLPVRSAFPRFCANTQVRNDDKFCSVCSRVTW